MNNLFYIFYFTVISLSCGFPTETNSSTNNTSTKSLAVRKYSKPRIISNVYRSNPGFMSPINPMENLLLYLLLSAGKDFGDDEYEIQKEHERKRSPDIFSDAIGDIAIAAGNLMNGTKNTFSRIEETFSRGTRESPMDFEIHPHPIAQEGTCMCFNRIFRPRSNHHFEPILRPKLINREKNDKIGNFNVGKKHSFDENFLRTIDNATNGNSTSSSIRILKVADLIGDDSKTTEGIKTSSGLINKGSDLDDEMILELQQQTSQSGVQNEQEKRNYGDNNGPPPWLENIKSPVKHFYPFTNNQKTTSLNEIKEKRNESEKLDDDGYYFLFYSGGTENRTTAKKYVKREQTDLDLFTRDFPQEFSNFLRRLKNFENDEKPIGINQHLVNNKTLKIRETENNKKNIRQLKNFENETPIRINQEQLISNKTLKIRQSENNKKKIRQLQNFKNDENPSGINQHLVGNKTLKIRQSENNKRKIRRLQNFQNIESSNKTIRKSEDGKNILRRLQSFQDDENPVTISEETYLNNKKLKIRQNEESKNILRQLQNFQNFENPIIVNHEYKLGNKTLMSRQIEDSINTLKPLQNFKIVENIKKIEECENPKSFLRKLQNFENENPIEINQEYNTNNKKFKNHQIQDPNVLRRLQTLKDDKNLLEVNEGYYLYNKTLKIRQAEDTKKETKSDQTKSDQTKSDQTKSDQTKSDQTKSKDSKVEDDDDEDITFSTKTTEALNETEPINGTTPFPDDEYDDGDDQQHPGDGSDKKSNTYLYSVTIPTAICIILLIVGLCFLAKPTGACCDRFLRNPDQSTVHKIQKRPPHPNKRDKAYRTSQQDLKQDEVMDRSRRVPLQEYDDSQRFRDSTVSFGRVDRRIYQNADLQLDILKKSEDKERIGKEEKEIYELNKNKVQSLGDSQFDDLDTLKKSIDDIDVDKEKIWIDEEIEDMEKRSVPFGDLSYHITSI